MSFVQEKFIQDVKKSIRHSIIKVCENYKLSETNIKYNLNLDVEIPIDVCDEVNIVKEI